MSRASSRKQQHSLTADSNTGAANDADDIFVEDDSGIDDETGGGVTRRICLKKTIATGGSLDKQVVLRRIRRRKRVNMVKSAINFLFASTTAASPGGSSPNKIRWVDDPFAAP